MTVIARRRRSRHLDASRPHGPGRTCELEDPMKLELEVLAVDSFETTKAEPAPAPVNVDVDNGLTCLQTNCGKFLCCA